MGMGEVIFIIPPPLEHQWIQWDLGPPHRITGIITKGRGDTRRRHWVQSYTLTYSNDTLVWYTYRDTNHLEAKVGGGGKLI